MRASSAQVQRCNAPAVQVKTVASETKLIWPQILRRIESTLPKRYKVRLDAALFN